MSVDSSAVLVSYKLKFLNSLSNNYCYSTKCELKLTTMCLNLADKLHIFKPKMNYFKQKYQQMNSGLSIPKVAIK